MSATVRITCCHEQRDRKQWDQIGAKDYIDGRDVDHG